MIALKRKPKATKYSDHQRISLTAHTAKIVSKIPRRRIEKKIEDVDGEGQLGFRRGKGTRDAVGMVRKILERSLEIDEELCVCFTDWQKAFGRVNWTKLMQILKKTGIDWRERRLISNLYMAESVKVRLNRRRQEV
jgi:hypothetical protein